MRDNVHRHLNQELEQALDCVRVVANIQGGAAAMPLEVAQVGRQPFELASQDIRRHGLPGVSLK